MWLCTPQVIVNPGRLQRVKELDMKTAHYYASRSQKFLVIGVDGRQTDEKYEVANKSEARKLANELSAKPWNF